MPDEKWKVRRRETVLRHPYVTVTMEQVALPDGRLIDDWPIVETPDFVNAVVLDEMSRAMIISGYKHGLGRSSWQVVGGYLEEDEDPLEAIKRELLEETGYEAETWQSLGSFVMDANRGVAKGHFFLARDARPVAAPDHDDLESFEVSWVPVEQLRVALADGSVGVASYAINIALALLALDGSRSDTTED